jgi:DNA-binding CsgD family transcriptional regulator
MSGAGQAARPKPPGRTRRRHVNPTLATWIDQEREARAIVTSAGMLLWISTATMAMLEGPSPFHLANGRLTGRNPIIDERLSWILSTVGEQIHCWPVDDAGAWVVWAQRIGAKEPGCIGLRIRRCGQAPAFTALAEARRLTPAEGRIISMMLSGGETAGIAAALDISVETLRTHVKHAYRKVGVTSRGELFAAALPFLEP